MSATNARNIIGTAIILTALAIGAYFGHITNNNQPANATTPDTNMCSVICAQNTGGSIGNTTVLPGGTTGGIGNNR